MKFTVNRKVFLVIFAFLLFIYVPKVFAEEDLVTQISQLMKKTNVPAEQSNLEEESFSENNFDSYESGKEQKALDSTGLEELDSLEVVNSRSSFNTSSTTSVPKGYPEIVKQPKSTSTNNGKYLVVYLTANNVNEYQWQCSADQGQKWTNLTDTAIWNGINKSQLYFIPLPQYNGYVFRCKLTNQFGTVYSDTFTLKLDSNGEAQPTVTDAPLKTPTVKPTATVKPTTMVTATPTITPAPTSTPKVTKTPAVKPTSTPNSATSIPKGYPEIVKQPRSISANNGKYLVVYLTANNVNEYQWQCSADQGQKWTNLTDTAIWNGINKSQLYFIPLPKYNGYVFRCKLTNQLGTVYSDTYILKLDSNGETQPTVTNAPLKTPTVKPTATVKPTTMVTATPTITPAPTSTPKATKTPTVKPTLTPNSATSIPKGYPEIVKQPRSISANNGKYLVVYLTANNVNEYQWQCSADQGQKWTNLTDTAIWNGINKSQLYFIPLPQYNGYVFRCKLTNQLGTVYSDTYTLKLDSNGEAQPTATVKPTTMVTATPSITPTPTEVPKLAIVLQPQNISAESGREVHFSIRAENASVYQWYYRKNTSDSWKQASEEKTWLGVSTSTLSFTSNQIYNGYQFCCHVSGLNTTVISDSATFSFVGETPTFDTSIDTVVTGVIGSYVTLKAKVNGAVSYQWEVNPQSRGVWTAIQDNSVYQNTTGPELTIKLISGCMLHSFRLKVISASGIAYYSPVYTLREPISSPANVVATALNSSEISVNWSAVSDSRVEEYQVFYNKTNRVDYSQFVTVTGTSAQLSQLDEQTTYYIWVRANGASASSVVNNNAFVTATTKKKPVKPNGPTDVNANASSTSMSVSWKKPTNTEVDGYIVYYQLSSASTIQKRVINGGNTLSAIITGLEKNTSYNVWVSAFNEVGESPASSYIEVKTLLTMLIPAQPTNVKAVTNSNTSVKVTWTRSTSSDVAGYNVYYGMSNDVVSATKFVESASANSTSLTVTNLKAGTTYYFWVSAFNHDMSESTLDINVRASAVPKSTSTSGSNKINAEYFSKMGDKYIGTSYAVYDCQAFVEKMLSDAGLKNYNLAGSNAWYRQMSWRGTAEQCIAKFGCIPTGAFLFIVKHDGGEPSHYNDSLGNASHIGVVTHRNGGAIHSSYSRYGVYTSVFNDATIPNGGWNMIGLWTRMDYGEAVNSILEGR